MPSSHLFLCHPLFFLPPIPPSIRVFSNESALGMRWPKYWSFSFSIIPSKEIPGLIFRMDWLYLPAVLAKPKRIHASHEIKRRLVLGRKTMINLDSIFKSRDITLPTKVCLVKAMVFPVVCMDVRVGLWRRLSTKELMLLNCGVGEDSWESLGLQGDPTSPF